MSTELTKAETAEAVPPTEQSAPERLPGRDTDWDAYESSEKKRVFKSYRALGINYETVKHAAEEVAHWNRQYRELAWENAREAVAAVRASPEAAQVAERASHSIAAKFTDNHIYLRVDDCEHRISGETADRLVNELLTSRHLEMSAEPQPAAGEVE